MRAVQRTLLHFAAFAALLLAVFPVIAMVCTLAGFGTVHMWLIQLYIVLTGTAALFHAILIRRIYRRKPVIVNISLYAAGAVFAGIAFMLCPFAGIFMKVIAAMAVLAVYQAGARLFFVEYDTLTHTYVYAGICTVFVLTSAVIWFSDRSASFIWQAVVLLVISGIFSLCRNFAGIDTALQTSGDESAPLPKGILKYNRLLLCGIGAVLLVLVLLRKSIGSFLGRIAGTAVKLLGKAFFWFSGLFTGKEQESTELAENTGIPEASAYEQNDVITLVCTVILLAMTLFVLVKYRERIIRGIADFIRGLRRFFGRIFGRSYEKQESISEGGYTDYYEEITGTEKDILRKNSSSFRWKKELRRYRKMKSGQEKYRAGYSLLLYRLNEKGIPVSAELTPRELLLLIPDEHHMASELEVITAGYERVRYGDSQPEEDEMETLERMLIK